MKSWLSKSVLVLCAIVLSACSGGKSQGPDEFAVVPTKPLTIPEDLITLPTPRPGTINRVDVEPNKDAVAALGGDASSLNPTVARASEGALLTATTRYGIDPNIRETLRAADKVQRKRKGARLLERLAGQTDSARAYREFTLDQYAELERLRRLGVRTPTAPPEQ